MNLKPLGDRLMVSRSRRRRPRPAGSSCRTPPRRSPRRARSSPSATASDEDGDKRIPLDVAEGDEVLYSKYGGTEIIVDGEDLLVLRESDVLAKVEG